MSLIPQLTFESINAARCKFIEFGIRPTISTRFYTNYYSTLSNVKTNEIPMLGMRHLKLNGTQDSKFWIDFISTTSQKIEFLSPHSFAILSSVVIHLIPKYPESMNCIQKIFDTLVKRPIILKGLNVEMLNMILVSYYSMKPDVDLNIIGEIVKRCDEQLVQFNKNVVEINVELMHSLAKCTRKTPKLFSIINKTGIINTFTSFTTANIARLNPRELAITVYSFCVFGIPNSIKNLLFEHVKLNAGKFQPLDLSTIIFASKDSKSLSVIPILSFYVTKYLMEFTPQQISNLLFSFMEFYSSLVKSSLVKSSLVKSSISCKDPDNFRKINRKIALLVERAAQIFSAFNAQEAFNVVNAMLRCKYKPALEFTKSYSLYLLERDFSKFKFVDLFTLFNSTSDWFEQMKAALEVNFTSIIDRASLELTKFLDKTLSFEKIIYVLYYITRVSSSSNSAIDSAINILSSSDLSFASVKHLCLIKASISKFMPKYYQLNEKVNRLLVERLSKDGETLNQKDLTTIFEGYNDQKLDDLAVNLAFKLKNLPLSLLFTILNSGSSPDVVERAYQTYVKIVKKNSQINVFDAYKIATILSDKGYRHLFLDLLESIALKQLTGLSDPTHISEFSSRLIVSIARCRSLTPSIGHLVKRVDYNHISPTQKTNLIHSLVLLDWPAEATIDNCPSSVLGIYSLSWLIYMGKIDFSAATPALLKKCIMTLENIQETSQIVKSVYFLLSVMDTATIATLPLDLIKSLNNVLSTHIARPKTQQQSRYSDLIYDCTKTICLKQVDREAAAGLDYSVDLLIRN